MLAFIHENYERPIQLCEIARAANVSARECLRCFQRAIQTPPMQYLLKYRVAARRGVSARTPRHGGAGGRRLRL